MRYCPRLDRAAAPWPGEDVLNATPSSERWRQIKSSLARAIEAEPAQREALFAQLSAQDPELAREVRSLFGWHEGADPAWFTVETESDHKLSAGDSLGPYEILDLLDAGGMGAVYRARDTRLDRIVAIKVLSGPASEDPGSEARFEHEARTVAALSHPNLLSIFDYGREGKRRYAVTEMLHGENLRQRLRRGPMPVTEALAAATQIANGLAAAHERGIVHRDLKPENIFLTESGALKILDFGLAKHLGGYASSRPQTATQTRAGMILGSVGYMAPEQVRGEPVDTRADVFAFGVLLHEMITGRRPFGGATPAEALAAVLRDDVPPYDPALVPLEIGRILDRCLARDRADRFANAAEVREALGGSHPALQSRRSRVWRSAAMSVLVGIALASTGSAPSAPGNRIRAVDLTIKVGRGPMALTRAGEDIWVANRDSNSVTTIRIADGLVAATIAVGDLPTGLGWDGRFLWVANHGWRQGGYSTLSRIDPKTGAVNLTLRTAGQPMFVTADATHLWVSETWPSYVLRKLRRSDGKEVGAFTAGGAPRQAVTDGESVWVANGPIQAVTRLRASDGEVLGSVPIAGVPVRIERVGDHLWVAANSSRVEDEALYKLSLDLRVVSRIETPGAAAMTVSERWLFVADAERILQRRATDGEIVAAWRSGPQPSSLLFDGTNLWVADYRLNTVAMISGRRLEEADRQSRSLR